VRAVIHRFIATLAKSPLWTLEIGQEIGLTELITHLTELAFTRTDLVEKRGEFAVRGGIVDVFLPLAMHPVRIDFFGDEIEEMRYFEVADQRTSEAVVGKLAILPCRELLLTESIRERAEKIKSQYPSALEILDKVAQGTIVDGMESLIPLLTDDFETILDRMPKGAQVIFIEPLTSLKQTKNSLKPHGQMQQSVVLHHCPLRTLPTSIGRNSKKRFFASRFPCEHSTPLEAISMTMRASLISLPSTRCVETLKRSANYCALV
jgi:transcription-repair coupling factor (superfamily II helicase)